MRRVDYLLILRCTRSISYLQSHSRHHVVIITTNQQLTVNTTILDVCLNRSLATTVILKDNLTGYNKKIRRQYVKEY
jgi:hypothetical protein